MTPITLDGETLDIHTLWKAAQSALDPKAALSINVSKDARTRIDRASDFVRELAESGNTVYGINTGFGFFKNTRISKEQIKELQTNIILSHCCGVGEPLSRDLVMAMWLIMLNSMCRGHRGLAWERMETIIKALEAGMLAVVPGRGSVGASGDLAPMAHAVAAMLGVGDCTLPDGDGFVTLPASEGLKRIGLKPLELEEKEGLCLINGTQLTTAMAAKICMECEQMLKLADMNVAMIIDGMRASYKLLHPGLLAEQGHPGSSKVAQDIANWLDGSTEIPESHADCDRVQDPYSIRCAPQVHGMVHDTLSQSIKIINDEINNTTDNPMLFPEHGEVIHGGNFHAIYAARVCDQLASAMATLANICERRVHMAMKSEKSGLPDFLIKEGGLHSGLMMAQTTAAALASECKSLSFPASVDSISTNNDQEDHVSMGPIAGHKALKITELLRYILAIELLTACQALDLLSPMRSSPQIEAIRGRVRKVSPTIEKDRFLHADIESVYALTRSLV